jgi:hypothetical protein
MRSDETVVWEYAMVEVSGRSVVDVGTPEGQDQIALRTGKERGLAAVMSYLGSLGWKLSRGTSRLVRPEEGHKHLILFRESESQVPAAGAFYEPPS